MQIVIEEKRVVQVTRLAKVFSERLEEVDSPVQTDYQLFKLLYDLYDKPEGLYVRKPRPSVEDYRRTRRILLSANIVAQDSDYPGAYRVISKPDLSADEIVCIVDYFCYVSHLSAMQRYGLTDRRPEALHLTTPSNQLLKQMIKDKVEQDFPNKQPSSEIHRLNIVHHPEIVRKRRISNFSTVKYGDYLQVRGSHTRIATIGQTFLDMLEEPELCGGMAHVIEIWKNQAKTYLTEIVSAVDGAHGEIQKVRAGYILDELLEVQRPELHQWIKFAQRGGSRVLDPSKPFLNNFSEKWMLSINV